MNILTEQQARSLTEQIEQCDFESTLLHLIDLLSRTAPKKRLTEEVALRTIIVNLVFIIKNNLQKGNELYDHYFDENGNFLLDL